MMNLFMRRIVAILVCVAALPAAAQMQVLSDMTDPAAWTVTTAQGVELRVSAEPGAAGDGLRLDYRFVTGSGYALIHLPLKLELPENYEFAFQVRGRGPANNLEFKLLDERGDSVWWINRRAFEWPAEWRRMSNKKRAFEFAWGPSAGAPLKRISGLEFAIASSSGGSGTVWLDELVFRPLPAPNAAPVKPVGATADAGLADAAIDGDMGTAWEGRWLRLDLGEIREFGGIDLAWKGHPPRAVDVDVSDDGTTWTRAAQVCPWAERSVIPTPDAEGRFVRLKAEGAIAEVGFRAPGFSADRNAMMSALAREAKRGVYPRAFLGEQTYFTVVGADGDVREALLSEDGAVEVETRGFSLEPFVRRGHELLTWTESRNSQSLLDDELPLPAVTREYEGMTLVVRPFVPPTDPRVLGIRYEVANTAAAGTQVELVVAARPFQVNPPWQRLKFEGGVSPIRSVEEGEGAMPPKINGRFEIVGLGLPALVAGFDGGDVVNRLAHRTHGLTRMEMAPADDLRSAAWVVPLELAAGERTAVTVYVVDGPAGPDVGLGKGEGIDAAAAWWRARLGPASITVPAADAWLAHTFRSQIAYILVNRDGVGFQPGSRSYERSWARDGSMTADAMMGLGFAAEAKEWVDWYGANVFDNGHVPCVVDSRGPDPVAEHDSHGQYIWAVANVTRMTGDLAFARRHWERVKKVAAYIESLRAQRMTSEYAEHAGQKNPKAKFYGLVPESISHEGYSAKPMHSYWDDFFVLLGLKEAAWLAGQVGEPGEAARLGALADEFRGTLVRSIELARAEAGIDYIPGCAELGDFDATSTTIALAPCDEQDGLPGDALRATFDRAWTNFVARRESIAWDAYTPYELRQVGSFVRLGEPERAFALLDFFRDHRRPAGWNHWAEVVWREERAPKFLGDMPHTWVGSDFIHAVRSVFLYEHAEGYVAFGGVPKRWIEAGEPVGFTAFEIPGGSVSGRLEPGPERVRVTLTGDGRLPRHGITVAVPPGCRGERQKVERLPAEVFFPRER